MLENKQELATIESLNTGKPLTNSLQEARMAAEVMLYFGGYCDKIKGSVIPIQHNAFAYVKKEPVGVAGQIIPWNYPLLMQAWKLGPALCAGCTIVMKPSEVTPLSAIYVCKLIQQAGFPKGVVNLVTGSGSVAGAAITASGQIDKVAFTGSTKVGLDIMKNGHEKNLKRVTLELGGKSANIIMGDADIDKAVCQASAIYGNCGQCCIAPSRAYVHESIYDKFIEKFVAKNKQAKCGSPFDESTTLGPLINKKQFETVLKYIETGKKEGARLVAGGKRVGDKGYFIEPTVFADVTDDMTICKEEIFGPVLVILKFKDEAEVIKRANASNYGLGGAVVTKDIPTAFRVADKLKAGTVYVNCYFFLDNNTPFGGYKDSGIGRELGEEGLSVYLESKTVIINRE